jgi:hypothetical protein
MSEGSSGEPEREQDPWSQPADSAPPGAAEGQPEVADHPSAGPDSWSTTWANPAGPGGYASTAPDSWSTTWANPASPTGATAPDQPGSSDGTGQQLPSPDGFSPPGAYPWTTPAGGSQPPAGQYPPAAGQYGYQPTAGQYPQASGQYPQAAGRYGPQQWPAFPAAPRNNRVAIAALVCGIGQFALGLLVVGNILLAVPAIICGAIGLKQINRRGEGGRGIAIAGLVLGILGVVYFVIIALVLIIFASIHGSGSSGSS